MKYDEIHLPVLALQQIGMPFLCAEVEECNQHHGAVKKRC